MIRYYLINNYIISVIFLIFQLSQPSFAGIFNISEVISTPASGHSCNSDLAVQTTITAKSNRSNLLWSLPDSWIGGVIPNKNEDVIIPSGANIMLDQDVNVKSISIMGSLIVDVTKNIAISAEYLMVTGSAGYFEWGTESKPYLMKGTITLVGSDPTALIPGHNISSKSMMVMNGGKVEMHGKPTLKSWVQLNKTAPANTNQLTFKENTDWVVGDSIIIASTDFDMNQAEQQVISKIINSKTIEIGGVLAFSHFGELQYYQHGLDATINWTLDERAEVGLLSKNIKIQGDGSSNMNGFGGHFMVMTNSSAKIENVELARMGQIQKIGRYAFHWHLVGDGSGQYFNNNSVHHTFNRAITIHATNNVEVKNNVCYNNLGHAFFLEDGVETGIIMTNNLGLVTRRLSNIGDPGTRDLRQTSMLPSDTLDERNASGPATFWITNPNNTIAGNHAAGSDGSGIWYSPFVNQYKYNINPPMYAAAIPNGFLDNNVMHSCNHGFIFGVSTRPGSSTEEPQQLIDLNFGIDPPANSLPTVRNLLMYKNALGGYMRTRTGDDKAAIFKNMIIADNRIGEASTWKTFIDSSLWVSTSKNYTLHPQTPNIGSGTNADHVLYDGPTIITNSHFGGDSLLFGSVANDKISLFDQWGGNLKFTGHSLTNTTVAPAAKYVNMVSKQGDSNSVWVAATIRDHDGKFFNKGAGVSIMRNIPIMYDASTMPITSSGNTRYGSLKFGYLEFHNSDHTNNGNTRPKFTKIIRSDGPQYGDLASISGFPISPILNKNYTYRLMFKERIASSMQSAIYSMDGNDTLQYEIPNVPNSIKVYTGNELNYGELALNANKKPFSKVADKAALKLALKSAYTWENGTVFVKYIAPEFSSYQSANVIENIFFCLYNDCANGDNERVIISDFPVRDTRGDLIANPLNVSVSPINNSIGKDSYTITKKGNQDACVDYSLNMDVQNWEGISQLNINSTGLLGSDVFIKDLSVANEIKIGSITSDNGYLKFNLPTAVSQIDQVSKIIIRTCESSFTANSKTIQLDEISLGDFPAGAVTAVDDNYFDPNLSSKLNIYPNPSKDGVFNLSQSASWKVYSLLGMELRSGNSNQINLSEFNGPVYLIKLNDQIQKLVVE